MRHRHLPFLLFLSSFVLWVGVGQAQQHSQEPSREAQERRGTAWTGAPGIVETTAAIMAREAETQAIARIHPGVVRRAQFPFHRRPDRRNLPQNPDSPRVASWPPSPAPDLSSEQRRTTEENRLQPVAQTASLTFDAFDSSSTLGPFPPDTMGAVGPTQFLLAINYGLISFSKTTGQKDGQINVTLDTFFASVRNGYETTDPRVRYDRLSGRWFVTAINFAIPNRVMIAVSNGAAITSATAWTFFYFEQDLVSPAGDSTCFTDAPSLGVDVNGLYIAGDQFCGSSLTFTDTAAFAVQKASVLGSGPIVVTAFRNLATGMSIITPQAADNYDPNATQAFFVGTNAFYFGQLVILAVSFQGSTAVMGRPLTVNLAATAYPIPVPHKGNTAGTQGYLDSGDDRLTMAHFRNGSLWTAHNIGVDSTGAASYSADRNAIRWYEIIGFSQFNNFPSVRQSGTVFTSGSPGSLTQRSYWMPSLVVSGQGTVLLGSSTAGASEFINTAFTTRLSSDPAGQMNVPTQFTSSSTAYNPAGDDGSSAGVRRWGDYSFTSLDPADDQTMWTIQQFCSATNVYGLQVAKVLGPPPDAPISASIAVAPGQAGAEVIITGSGMYDPGSGFPNHISASVTGGVAVSSVAYLSSSSIRLNISTAGASLGVQSVTVTNPDGQSATGAGVLTIATSGCTFSVTPTSQSFVATGGTGYVDVNAGYSCHFTATSSSSFITINPGPFFGTGQISSVIYTVAANPSTNPRSGTITIAGSTLTINQAGLTTTSVSFLPSPSTSVAGQPVTLTATVTPSTATGTVTFLDGTNAVGTGTLVNGQATLTTALLPVGVRSLQASYPGDSLDAASNSPATSITVLVPPNLPHMLGSYLIGPDAASAAPGDFNGDGNADLVVTNGNGAALLLGNGDGTFRAPTTIALPFAGSQLVVGDFNGDGKADLAVGGVVVLLGKGDGTFGAPVVYDTTRNATCVSLADFNGDGKADLFVGGGDSAALLLGKGDGTFQSAITYGFLGDPCFFAVGDFNRDGKTDIAVGILGDFENGNGLEDGPSYLEVWLNSGSTSKPFQGKPTAYNFANLGALVVAGDFNGDGKTDLALTNTTGVSVMLGNGDGTFQTPVNSTAAGPYSASIVVADFNGDGKLDLALANTNNNIVEILLGNGDGTFQPPINYSISGASSLAVGDFNGDGRPDLVVVSRSTATVTILLGAAPQLTIAATHSGGFQQAQTGAAYNLAIGNSGSGSTSAAVTVTDSLPAGLTATSISGTGWTCTLSSLTCTRADVLAPGASYPAIAVTVNVSNTAPASVTDAATVSGGGVSTTNSASDPTTISQISLGYAGPAVALAGNSAKSPITAQLPAGVSLDSLSMIVAVTPVGSAPALSGTLTFSAASGQPSPAVSNAGSGAITLTYSHLTTPLSGTLHLGDVTITVPANASVGQSYTIHVTVVSASLSGNAVSVTAGADATLSTGVPYLVGDVFPSTTDSDTNFGDAVLNTLDLIAMLRAVTGLPGFTPAACSDRFDAMDAFPLDTAVRGGDGKLNTLDLITILKRVTNLDTSRPTRVPRGQACSSQAPQSRMPARKPEAVIELSAEEGGTAIYLSSAASLSLSGLSFSLGSTSSAGANSTPLHFAAADTSPSLVDTGVPGTLSLAWLEGVTVASGQRVLLGHLEGVSPEWLKLWGSSANTTDTGREVAIGLRLSR
jgi:hypothetical protein